MLGSYFPGQSYPGQSGGYSFNILIRPDGVSIATTIDNVSLTQNHVLVVQDILQANNIDPALVIRPLMPQSISVQTGIDNVLILVKLKPKPQPPTVTIDYPAGDVEVITITGDLSQGHADIAGAYAEKPRGVAVIETPAGGSIEL